MSVPESFTTGTEDSANGHPAISQRKKAKKAREAKRKAKKQSIPEAAISLPDLRNEATEDVYDVGDVLAQSASMLPETILYNKDRDSSQDVLAYTESANDHDASIEVVSEPISTDTTFAQGVSPVPLPEPVLPITKHGKHMHWIRFARRFISDQLTNPFPPSWDGCSHSTSCSFENNDFLDCPFHEPRKCIATGT